MSNTSVTTPAPQSAPEEPPTLLPEATITMVRPVFDEDAPFIDVRFRTQSSHHFQRYFFTKEVNARISKSELESALKADISQIILNADAFVGMKVRYEQLDDAVSKDGQRTYEQFRLYPLKFALDKDTGSRFLAKIQQFIS